MSDRKAVVKNADMSEGEFQYLTHIRYATRRNRYRNTSIGEVQHRERHSGIREERIR